MTESAEQRTKRRFREYLDLTDWTYQYSFFYQCSEDAREFALSDATRLKEKLRRAKSLRSQPFLYRLCLYQANAFHTVFTTKPIDLNYLQALIEKASKCELKVAGRAVSEWKIERYKNSVYTQRPHNLVGFFGDKKINRIALLNAKAIM